VTINELPEKGDKCKKHPKYKVVRKPTSDCRHCLFIWQRKTRGWDDSDTWALHQTIAELVLPRLKRFEELTCGTPMSFMMDHDEYMKLSKKDRKKESKRADKSWHAALQKMVAAFEFLASDEYWNDIHPDSPKHQKKNEGLDLFCKHYEQLWW
jgi:hypothetical protein